MISQHTFLNLAQNSFRAHSKIIKINIEKNDTYHLTLIDHGHGMTKSQLKEISSPFYTTRTTRKIGLGIPFMILLCEQTEGKYHIQSIKGLGTKLDFTFNHKHLDFPNEGDYGLLIADLIQHQDIRKLKFKFKSNRRTYSFKWKKENTQSSRKEMIANINKEINGIEDNHEIFR